MTVQKRHTATRGVSFPAWSIPIALLALTVISYGARALSLGFYWDDWPYLWFFHRLGADGIITAFTGDRPFPSFIYTLTLTAFGDSSQAWQMFGLAARWLFSLGFWWMLALTWPKQANKTVWAAFLFAVYPGFTQQWISVIYGQAFLLFAATFFSIDITLWMARHRSTLGRGWIAAGTVLALALSAFCMFSTEYMFGLELLRPLLLWIILSQQPDRWPKGWFADLRRNWFKVALWWAPYLALMISFVIWRGFIHVFPEHELSTLGSIEQSPLNTVWGLTLTILEDWIESGPAAWGQTLQLEGFISDNMVAGLRWLVIFLATGLACWYYLLHLRQKQAQEDDAPSTDPLETIRWGSQACLIGLFILLAGGWPFWITGIPMRMGFPLDRYTLPLAGGICLVAAGLVDLFGKSLGRKVILLSALVALAAGFHFQLAGEYLDEWKEVREIFWQLTWRAPEVKANTLFLSENLPLPHYEDDSLTAPLNWTYDPDGRSTEMNYLLYDLPTRRKSFVLSVPGITIERDFRATRFSGNTSQVLVLYYQPPGCLRVLDPVYDAEFLRMPDRLLLSLPLSNPKAVIEDTNQPATPPSAFGSEPRHRWCYYFEKAELARQQGDWNKIVALSRESIGKGIRPQDSLEYLPFVEGLLQAGLWEDAYSLAQSTYSEAPVSKLALCAVWKRNLPALQSSELGRNLIQQINANLGCALP